MKKIFFLVFIFLFSSPSFASQIVGADVLCPGADIGRIKFIYNSLGINNDKGVLITANTNLASREGFLLTYNQELLLPAKCDSLFQPFTSHLSFSTTDNGIITYTAVWVSEDYPTIALILDVSAFAFGVVLALSFLQGVKSHV
ncbi:MAG: hypothetical protein HZA11_07835 [Nitrospirae bacterium]|nr:hypothetical protein [Nitrospirota bacterium]